jgi:hypothetical protein
VSIIGGEVEREGEGEENGKWRDRNGKEREENGF